MLFLSLSVAPPGSTPETSTGPPTMFFHHTPIISWYIGLQPPSCSFGNFEWKKEVSHRSVGLCHADVQGAVCAHPDSEEKNPHGAEHIRAKSSTSTWERRLHYSAKCTVGWRRLSSPHLMLHCWLFLTEFVKSKDQYKWLTFLLIMLLTHFTNLKQTKVDPVACVFKVAANWNVLFCGC